VPDCNRNVVRRHQPGTAVFPAPAMNPTNRMPRLADRTVRRMRHDALLAAIFASVHDEPSSRRAGFLRLME
jgi:hypothetical protein